MKRTFLRNSTISFILSEKDMKTREDALLFGLSFPDTYQDAPPFHDTNWQLVRYKGNKKAFLWTYERNGYINLNVKVDPDKAFIWRDIYKSVIPGYHQNKENWNTIILDGTIPDGDIRIMIAESYDLISDSPTKRIYEAVKKIPKGKLTDRWRSLPVIRRWPGLLGTHSIRIRIRRISPVFVW